MATVLDNFQPFQKLAVAAGAALVGTTGVLQAVGAPHVLVFFVAALGLAALAALVGESIEQIGERLGPGPTGLLQSTLGNLPELLVSIFALRAGLSSVVQAALIGSVLGNVLLVLGVAFYLGAARHGTQRFDPGSPRMIVALLCVASSAVLIPTLATRLGVAAHHAVGLSDATAVILLLVYLASIPFWLSGGPDGRGNGAQVAAEAVPGAPGGGTSEARAHVDAPRRPVGRLAEAPTFSSGIVGGTSTGGGSLLRHGDSHGDKRELWPLPVALGMLAAASIGSGALSEWFVSSLIPATRSLGISPVFTGLVIVAIASNSVENAGGIRFAWKARPDYAISTILNSPLQIALFLAPVLVLVSPVLGPHHLTLVFPPLLIAALAVASIVVTIVVYDGEYSSLEGVALVALYAIIAAAFWWG